jgi:hypothetical protein
MEYVPFTAKVEFPGLDQSGLFVLTGEFRTPEKGEYYICFDDPEVVLLRDDNEEFNGNRRICKKVGA